MSETDASHRRIRLLEARLDAIGFPRCRCHPAQDDSEHCLPDPARWVARRDARVWMTAAAMVQDYGHHLTQADVVRVQAPLLRMAEVTACTECDADGQVRMDDGGFRVVDHHPMGGRRS